MWRQPSSIEEALRQARLICIALMVSIVLYLRVMVLVQPWADGPPSPVVYWGLCAMGLLALGTAQFFRWRFLPQAVEALSTKPDDTPSLRHLQFEWILGGSMAEGLCVVWIFRFHAGRNQAAGGAIFRGGFCSVGFLVATQAERRARIAVRRMRGALRRAGQRE
jgi:hypothetical protein